MRGGVSAAQAPSLRFVNEPAVDVQAAVLPPGWPTQPTGGARRAKLPQSVTPKPYRSRLDELSRPERTSVRNSLSQNCVPAWMLRRRNLQRGGPSVCMSSHHNLTCNTLSVHGVWKHSQSSSETAEPVHACCNSGCSWEVDQWEGMPLVRRRSDAHCAHMTAPSECIKAVECMYTCGVTPPPAGDLHRRATGTFGMRRGWIACRCGVAPPPGRPPADAPPRASQLGSGSWEEAGGPLCPRSGPRRRPG